jgi:outer membrane protein OmpA-like peptidoglycan-associated protein
VQATIKTGSSPVAREGRTGGRDLQRLVITVEGHTDSFGGDESNLELSQRRADAVRAYLLANMQLAPYRISAMGYGETRPISSNETAEGRSRNRRIDLVVLRSGD